MTRHHCHDRCRPTGLLEGFVTPMSPPNSVSLVKPPIPFGCLRPQFKQQHSTPLAVTTAMSSVSKCNHWIKIVTWHKISLFQPAGTSYCMQNSTDHMYFVITPLFRSLFRESSSLACRGLLTVWVSNCRIPLTCAGSKSTISCKRLRMSEIWK